jgi:hypothetical protein
MSVKLTFDERCIDFDKFESKADGSYLTGAGAPAPGAAWWLRLDSAPDVLMFICPCGCGSVTGLPVNARHGNHWKFNGDEVSVTLAPSVFKQTACKWHGFLTNGVWTQC